MEEREREREFSPFLINMIFSVVIFKAGERHVTAQKKEFLENNS